MTTLEPIGPGQRFDPIIAILGGLSGVRWRLPVFESVLNSDRIASGGVKTGALLATFVHAGLIAGAVFLSGREIVSSRPPAVNPPVIVLKNPGNSGGAGQSTASKEASPAPARHRRPARMVQTGAVIAKKVSPVEAREDIPQPIADHSVEQSSASSDITGVQEGPPGAAVICPGGHCGPGLSVPYTPGPADPGIRTIGPGMRPPRLVDPGEQLQYTSRDIPAEPRTEPEIPGRPPPEKEIPTILTSAR